jgi:fatty acid amide hydrolase
MSAFEFFHAVNSIETIRMEFFDLWKEKSLDCLISPSWGIPAAAHDKSDLLKHTIIYQVLANVMNLAAGIVPVTKVQNNEQNYEDHINGNDRVAKAASECMKNSEGLPITVQVLTLPFEDEKCLGIMKVIEKNIDFHELPKI